MEYISRLRTKWKSKYDFIIVLDLVQGSNIPRNVSKTLLPVKLLFINRCINDTSRVSAEFKWIWVLFYKNWGFDLLPTVQLYLYTIAGSSSERAWAVEHCAEVFTARGSSQPFLPFLFLNSSAAASAGGLESGCREMRGERPGYLLMQYLNWCPLERRGVCSNLTPAAWDNIVKFSTPYSQEKLCVNSQSSLDFLLRQLHTYHSVNGSSKWKVFTLISNVLWCMITFCGGGAILDWENSHP